MSQRLLRIALTSPYCWPQVRRGSERLLHELSEYLAGRGHEVTVISTSPEGPLVEKGRVERVLLRQKQPPPWLGHRLTAAHFFGLQCRPQLRPGRFDVIQCFTHYDAFGASLAARPRTPFVFHCPGIPVKRAFRTLPHDALMFDRSARKAAVVAVVSRCAASHLEQDYGARARVLAPPVDLTRFRLDSGARSSPPTVLMVGAFEERRKGARLLLRAFAEVKRAEPDLRLCLSGQIGTSLANELLELLPLPHRRDVEVLGAGRVEDLPGLYARASVTVLPSVWEALGLVLAESLACGTPVVGANHGGIPEIVTSPEVGVLFEPRMAGHEAGNLEGLVSAIGEGLALAQRPETSARCRQAAERFGWERLGPTYEELLMEAAGR